MVWSEKCGVYRPRLILAYVDSAHAARCGRYFRRLGWEVHLVASAEEAQRLAARCKPDAVVVDIELPDESGWPTWAKLTHENPALRVVILAPDRSPETMRNLTNLRATALVSRQDRLDVLADTILSRRTAEMV